VRARDRIVRGLAVASVLALVLGACSDGDSSDDAGRTTTTRPAPDPMAILVTNDDGYAAAGIDAVVEALRELPGVEVTVVAPATNRSGTGTQTTPGPLRASEQQTASGYRVTAVEGFPADTITYALDEVLDEPPALVVSGVNEGQNLGPIAAISGTVGAAKAAVTAGIPALAASQGIGNPPDYAAATELVVEWVRAHRRALAAGTAAKVVVNLNVPTCPSGEVRGLQQVPLATEGTGLAPPPDCGARTTGFTDDVQAFLAGFATATELDAAGQTVTTSTTWPTS
jgi:5'-nucleotidase